MAEDVMPKMVYVTYRVNGKTIEFQTPIDDPFGRFTVNSEWRLLRWLPWPRHRTRVEVIINGTQELVDRVLELITEISMREYQQ